MARPTVPLTLGIALAVVLAGAVAAGGFALSAAGDATGSGDAGAPPAQSPTPSPTPTATPTPVPPATFGVEVLDVTVGDVAEVPVVFEEGTQATLVVGDAGTEFNATVTVQDGNGDGRVTVRFDTAAAGPAERFAVADDADGVSVDRSNGTSEQLPSEDYGLELLVEGDSVDNATLLLRDPINRNATPSPSPTPTATASPTGDGDGMGSPSPTATPTTTPGFGPLVGALAAVGAALILARRRR